MQSFLWVRYIPLDEICVYYFSRNNGRGYMRLQPFSEVLKKFKWKFVDSYSTNQDKMFASYRIRDWCARVIPIPICSKLNKTSSCFWNIILHFFDLVAGTGKSKKIAKRLAAHNMWQRLINLPAENNTQHIDCLDEEDMVILIKNNLIYIK